MPPPGLPRPDQATYEQLASTLETALDEAAAADPRPGRVVVHRLNRTEYTNAIRDLLALDVDGRALLAADEPDQQGFDNVAGVLSMSPRLLENYMTAASTVSRLAVGDSTISPVEDTVRIPTATVQEDRASDDLPFGSRGGVSIPYQFPLDGDYSIKVVLRRQLYLYLIGMGEPHQIDVRLDGTLLKRFTIGGEGKGMTAPESFAGNTQGEPQWEEYMHTADAGLTVRVPVTAGTHQRRRLVRAPALGARRRAAAAAARLRAHDQRAVLRQPVGGQRLHRRTSRGACDDGTRRHVARCSSAVPRVRRRKNRARDAFCPRSRAGRTAAR